jgi:hypothetical protein
MIAKSYRRVQKLSRAGSTLSPILQSARRLNRYGRTSIGKSRRIERESYRLHGSPKPRTI